MKRLIANKLRGASRNEGVMSESTSSRYQQTIRHFKAFLGKNILLDEITAPMIQMYKVERQKQIEKLKQSRGGSSIALDIAILHRIFAFAVSNRMMSHNPIQLRMNRSPAKILRTGLDHSRPMSYKSREVAREDLFMLLLLRWTGLRGSDAIGLQWQNVHLDRGVNGEIEVLTQKRSKTAIIPLSTELRNAIEEVYQGRSEQRKLPPDDLVLYNPDTDQPFSSRHRLYERAKRLGIRAGVKHVTPHCFRDTFACDMLARGEGIYEVAKMLADTVDTVEKHYAQFVPAARDAAQAKMDHGLGIEERAKLASTRGRKIAMFPGA
jgi:integrase